MTQSSRGNSKLQCSTCGRSFSRDETKTPPFCSERCQLIDLGRWLDEDIGVPHEGGPTNGEVVEPSSGEDDDSL
ncbi:MAG: DNA gyrase inhibitor YacG [Rubripirellula sp.]